MQAEDLRAIQAPIKQRYRDDATTALIPARAEGTLEMDGVACNVKVWKGQTMAGLHPARLGSSIGISKVHDESELAPAVELAREHDEKVLVEEFVRGMEVECGVLGNRAPAPIASLPGRIDTRAHEWYDYASKYDDDGMELARRDEVDVGGQRVGVSPSGADVGHRRQGHPRASKRPRPC